MFACLYVPDFRTQAAIRAEPGLRDRAVAVVEGKYPLLSVVCCNEKARDLGVELGMSRTEMAHLEAVEFRNLCAQSEAAASAALVRCAQEFSPRVEETAADTVTLDLAGMEKLFGAHAAIAQRVRTRVRDEGIDVNIAVAADPDCAMHAARGFAGITVIAAGREAETLAPLPIDVLRPGPELRATLEQWGIRDFGALAKLPTRELSERLGQQGLRLQALARGASARSLRVAEPEESFEETMELEYPVAMLEPLTFVLNELLQRICGRLESHALATNQLTLGMALEDGSECEQKIHFPVPMQERSVLLKLLHLRLAAHALTAPVVKVKLCADPVAPRHEQEGLFIPDAPAPEKLEVTLARVAKVVGTENSGSAELLDSHRPQAFRITHFTPSAAPSSAHSPASAQLALRMFRPAKKARVTLRDGVPVKLRFADINSEVLMAAGPWRSSGEWWEQRPWSREEWDVAMPEGLYRLVRDRAKGGWLVEGSYD